MTRLFGLYDEGGSLSIKRANRFGLVGVEQMILSERDISIAAGTVLTDDRSRKRKFESKRLIWLASIAGSGLLGIMAGIAALVISLLTQCGVIHDGRTMSVVVSALLLGCLGALFLAAHGMDRLTALRWQYETAEAGQASNNKTI